MPEPLNQPKKKEGQAFQGLVPFYLVALGNLDYQARARNAYCGRGPKSVAREYSSCIYKPKEGRMPLGLS